MSGSPGSQRPSASDAAQPQLAHPGDRWCTAGFALIGVWSALLLVAIALWVRAAFLSEADSADRGLVRLAGAPIVLVALGLLWWAWWSVRALRRGRREGWTLLLVLGGVSVVQAVLTSRAVLAAPTGAGHTADASGPPREFVGGLLAVIALGLVSVVVAVLARRSWAAADTADDSTPDDGVSDPG